MAQKKTVSKAKNAAKSTPEAAKTTRRHSPTRAPRTGTPDRDYTVIPNEPIEMAVLSEAQQAEVFDMTFSENPAADSQAAQDARVQAAIEPLGTKEAIQPIITEDGVVTPNAG